jgi:hypothetical protein
MTTDRRAVDLVVSGCGFFTARASREVHSSLKRLHIADGSTNGIPALRTPTSTFRRCRREGQIELVETGGDDLPVGESVN